MTNEPDKIDLAQALDPFIRVTRLQDPLNIPADMPMYQWMPRAWPTMGDCQRLVAASAELATLKAERDALKAALSDLVSIQGTVECLGEWEALEMNRSLRRTERAKVDAIMAQARAALEQTKP